MDLSDPAELHAFFDISIDQRIHLEGEIPQEVELTDKTALEQMKMIDQLDEEDRSILMKMIETLLTKKRFKDFFHKNVATL